MHGDVLPCKDDGLFNAPLWPPGRRGSSELPPPHARIRYRLAFDTILPSHQSLTSSSTSLYSLFQLIIVECREDELQRSRAGRSVPAPPTGLTSGYVSPLTQPPALLCLPAWWLSAEWTDPDTAFTSLKDSVSIQIFKIQSNVQGIQKAVDKLGGPQDGQALRTSLCVPVHL